MGVDVRQLEYFLAVADNGGITRAAEVLHIAQPSLSQAIRALERELKEPLFHRVGRGMVLAPAGEALIGPARQALRSVEHAREVVENVHTLAAGRLDICALPTLAAEPVASWVGYFRRLYPAVFTRIDEFDETAAVAEAVRSGGSELGFSTFPVSMTGLQGSVLSQQYMVLISPPGWPGTTSTTVSLEEIAKLPVIVDGRHTSSWLQIEQTFERLGLSLNVAAEVRHPSSTLHLVLAGAGATFLPLRLAMQAHRLGAVVQATDPPITRRVGVLYRPNELSGSAKAFLDLITQDAARWVRAMQTMVASGGNIVDAALSVDEEIVAARQNSTVPKYFD